MGYAAPLGRADGPSANCSAMRVCQPGPVARQRSMTSGGSRKLMSWRGFRDLGRPPLLTTARASMASVSSGSSLYSCGLITCASTRLRSEPEVRREAGLLTIVGLSHAEDVTTRATRGVADYDDPAMQEAVADNAAFTIVLTIIYDLDSSACEDQQSVFKIQATLGKGLVALGRIVGDTHRVIVFTKTTRRKSLLSLTGHRDLLREIDRDELRRSRAS